VATRRPDDSPYDVAYEPTWAESGPTGHVTIRRRRGRVLLAEVAVATEAEGRELLDRARGELADDVADFETAWGIPDDERADRESAARTSRRATRRGAPPASSGNAPGLELSSARRILPGLRSTGIVIPGPAVHDDPDDTADDIDSPQRR
jgi:hypothetical protein